ncbi:MAG: aminopeptidase [Bacteroidota bacterium]
MQLRGQLKIVFNTRPVSEVLDDPHVSKDTKDKLSLVGRVKRFGVEELGLQDTRNYESYFDQHGKPLMRVVTASEPYRLKAYSWRFPFLGRVSYKGFFETARADKMSEQLADEGFDVYAYPVGAWSTLGWLHDPVLSGMLDRDVGDLVELILHESLHATVYLKGSTEFNENLATVVGEEGSKAFLLKQFGAGSDELIRYQHQLHDDSLYVGHFIRGAAYLQELYASPYFKDAGQTKETLKQAAIARIIADSDTLGFLDADWKARIHKRKWNNAHFLSYLRYQGEKDSLRTVINSRFKGDIKAFVAKLQSVD